MNRQGQTGIISYFFVVVVFVIIWAIWLGGFLAGVGEQAIAVNHLTGIEAFLYGNINLFIFIALAVSVVAVAVVVRGGAE